MKSSLAPLAAILAAALAAGCVSSVVSRPATAPRYELSSPVPPPALADALPPAPLYVVSRVRASDRASGTAIRTLDADSLKTGILLDGEFALPPDASLRADLRSWIAAAAPDAQVFDASLAPRSAAPRVGVEAWIERFSLVRSGSEWSFRIDLRLLFEAPDGSLSSLPLSASAPVPSKSSRPSAPEALAAAAAALADLAP